MTISEFEEIAQRTESSMKHLAQVQSWLENNKKQSHMPGKLKELRDRVERECEKMTVRVNISKVEAEKQSATLPDIITQIFKVSLTDIGDHKAYMLLKHPAKRKIVCKKGQNFLVDKVKLIVN